MYKINELIKKLWRVDPQNIQQIYGGIMSKTYSFETSDSVYIIRFNSKRSDFDKDNYCFRHFSNRLIPIPKTIQIGKANDGFYYCITERCDGKIIDDFVDKDINNLVPLVLDLMYELKNIHISSEMKYGDFDGSGEAKFNTWKDYLVNTSATDAFTQTLYSKVLKLVKYCPEDKFLIHGDFGLNNILSDGIKITGIIDWGDAKYGDFLYDLAWISFWSSEIPYEELFLEYYSGRGVSISHYQERLTCYKCFLGINVLKFLQETGDLKTYDWVLKKLKKSLLKP